MSRLTGGTELTQKFFNGAVGEAEISAHKVLVEHGRAEKKSHLLFFDRLARRRQNVAAPGKDRTRNLPIEGRKKSECPLFEREDGIAPAQLNVMGESNAINIGGIDAQ